MRNPSSFYDAFNDVGLLNVISHKTEIALGQFADNMANGAPVCAEACSIIQTSFLILRI